MRTQSTATQSTVITKTTAPCIFAANACVLTRIHVSFYVMLRWNVSLQHPWLDCEDTIDGDAICEHFCRQCVCPHAHSRERFICFHVMLQCNVSIQHPCVDCEDTIDGDTIDGENNIDRFKHFVANACVLTRTTLPCSPPHQLPTQRQPIRPRGT